ncbi:MAG: hypothetical protein WBA10_17450 [Elainellaceae cyanobacterium]
MHNLQRQNIQRQTDILPSWLLALFLLTGVVSAWGSVRDWRDTHPPNSHPAAIAQQDAPQSTGSSEAGGFLSFDLPDIGAGLRRMLLPNRRAQSDAVILPPELEKLFSGETDSLVAKAVGAAEGTRLPNGDKTPAYFGHIDPGNGAWNQGTFSYQHEATSPEEADRKQIQRLRRQGYDLHHWAQQIDVPWGLEEQLNALDLANQAPLAALSADGYLDRLKEAYDRGYTGSDAVLEARIYAYLDPETNRWNAPGLGNTFESIRADQQRRQQAVAAAIAAGS